MKITIASLDYILSQALQIQKQESRYRLIKVRNLCNMLCQKNYETCNFFEMFVYTCLCTSGYFIAHLFNLKVTMHNKVNYSFIKVLCIQWVLLYRLFYLLCVALMNLQVQKQKQDCCFFGYSFSLIKTLLEKCINLFNFC